MSTTIITLKMIVLDLNDLDLDEPQMRFWHISANQSAYSYTYLLASWINTIITAADSKTTQLTNLDQPATVNLALAQILAYN